MFGRRVFSDAERDLIRRAHAGEMHMRALRERLRTGLPSIYREMRAMGLPYRKPDRRTRPAFRRDFLKLIRQPKEG